MSGPEFVERPERLPGGRPRGAQFEALVQTAANGLAIVCGISFVSFYRKRLKVEGVQVHMTKRGAPAGRVIAWCTRIEPAP
jgi:hypothetical protein